MRPDPLVRPPAAGVGARPRGGRGGHAAEGIYPPQEAAPCQTFVYLHDPFPQARAVRAAEVESRIGHDGADIPQVVGKPLEFAKNEEYPGVKAFLEKTASKVGVKIYS